MDELNILRAPAVKKVTLESINKTSEIYYRYKKSQLTREFLVNCSENMFVIAFFYNELYDINEYLQHLKKQPITNHSYNIIKLYAKDIACITSFFSKDNNYTENEICASAQVMTVLKGEVYRIRNIAIDDYSLYFLYGYFSVAGILLPSFEAIFDKYIGRCPEVISLLNFSEERVMKIIVKNATFLFEYLMSSNLMEQVFEFINFESFLAEANGIEKICKIFNHRKLQDTATKKLEKLKSIDEILRIAVFISNDRVVFNKIKDMVIGRIKRKVAATKLTLRFLLIVLYYETTSFDTKTVTVLFHKNKLAESNEYRLLTKDTSYDVNNNLLDKIKSCGDFNKVVSLFAEFIIFVETREYTLLQILDLPEKFFSYGLKFLKTDSAKNLKIFNDNLLNDRLKKTVYSNIDKHEFAMYLIKRRKCYDVDLSSYITVMDSTYKQMYGLFNLEWASKNINEVKDAMTDTLYRALKNSSYSDCIKDVDYKEIKQTANLIKNDTYAISKRKDTVVVNPTESNMQEEAVSKKLKLCIKNSSSANVKNEVERDGNSINDAVDTLIHRKNNKNILDESFLSQSKDINTEEDDKYQKLNILINTSVDSSNPNLITQLIYNEFNEEQPNYTSFIEKINNSEDYCYIVELLYGFTSKNKKFTSFYSFLKASAVKFNLIYKKHKEMIEVCYIHFKDADLFRVVAHSIGLGEILGFIIDYPHVDTIVQGLKDRFKDVKGKEYKNLIKKLVFSDVVSHVTVGAKLYALLDTPEFNLDHLLSFKNDEVIYEAVKQLKLHTQNEKLVSLLLSRGLTDELSAQICQKIDLSMLCDKNRQRIYSLFYLNPLNYIKFEMYKHGYNLDEHIVIDLIKALDTVYSEDLFTKVTTIITTFELTQLCFDQMISLMDTSNYMFKEWVLENVKTENITLPFFVKFCWFVSNEEDIYLVEKAITILKQGRVFDIIEKWAKVKKFTKLIRRIYPLQMVDRDFYFDILKSCPNEDERKMLESVYDLS